VIVLAAILSVALRMITMPLFFASNALYPVTVMPEWLRVLSHVNPLSYEVDALRGLLIGSPAILRWTSPSCSPPFSSAW
jgi:ABC-type multidrug transport system permease subunit